MGQNLAGAVVSPYTSRLLGSLDGLATALRLLRKAEAMSQEDLATRAGIGIAMVSRYERGTETPQIKTLARLLDAMELTAHDLAEALDSVNGRMWPASANQIAGSPRPEWVAAMARRGVDQDVLGGFALGALDDGNPRTEADFVASAVAAAAELARAAVEGAREAYRTVDERRSKE